MPESTSATKSEKTVDASELLKAKNQVRPFFRPRKPKPFWKQIQHIRKDIRPSARSDVLRAIENNKNYSFPGIGATFPTDRKRIPDARYRQIDALRYETEVDWCIRRLNFHKCAIIDQLNQLSRVNDLISEGKFEDAERDCRAITQKYGLSLATLKKEIFIAAERGGLPALIKRVKSLRAGCDRTTWSLFCLIFYDLADPTNHPVGSTMHWIEYASTRLTRFSWYARIVDFELKGYYTKQTDLADGLLRYSALSLLDLCLFAHKNNIFLTTRAEGRVTALDENIQQILRGKYSSATLPVINQKAHGRKVTDLEVFRTTFFFDEVIDVNEMRSGTADLILGNCGLGCTRQSSFMEAVADGIVTIKGDPSRLNAVTENLKSLQLSSFDLRGGVFQQPLMKMCLLAEVLRQSTTSTPVTDDKLAAVIASSPDVFRLVDQSVLNQIAQYSENNSPLLCFMAKELLYRKDRNLDNELERRLTFMSLFSEGDYRAIIKFIARLHLEEPDLAMFIARTCSRSFLEKLFLLMSSVKEVLEARIEICRWIESNSSDSESAIFEERGALEREYSNLDARSDLDSTRIHVDEDSLREWFQATQSTHIARYVQTVLAEDPNSKQLTALNSFAALKRQISEDEDEIGSTEIGSDVLLISIFEQTLKAFATDRSFGLDAYLSRRIRHGTLSGQIMPSLTRTLRALPKAINAFRAARSLPPHSHLDGQIDSFIKETASKLDHIRREIIQLKNDKHNDGLIRATWQIASNVAHLDATIARVRQRIIETQGNYDLFSDLYNLCWDCLEPDLAQLRIFMTRNFLPGVLTDLHILYLSLEAGDAGQASQYFAIAQATFEARVQEVCGWFIRPVFRRDRYDLRTLVDSILTLVRELDDQYKFQENVDVPEDIALNRASFDVFGDALYVLVHNAAKHGLKDGLLTVAASRDEQTKHITLDVKSLVETTDDYETACDKIVAALDHDRQNIHINRAAVEEGNSGLGKLSGIIQKVRSTYAGLSYETDKDDLSITFKCRLPDEIITYRS